MSSNQIPVTVTTALNQHNQNLGGMNMENTNQAVKMYLTRNGEETERKAGLQGWSIRDSFTMIEPMGRMQLQLTPTQFNVYDPNTGRNFVTDGTGRRITVKKEMTGTQLVRLQSMRNQMGLPTLKDHNVTMMSIDSASLMIDDMQKLIRNMQEREMEFKRQLDQLAYEKEVVMQELDKALQDPKVAVEIAKQRQADQAKN